jgi:hypothetical protein
MARRLDVFTHELWANDITERTIETLIKHYPGKIVGSHMHERQGTVTIIVLIEVDHAD